MTLRREAAGLVTQIAEAREKRGLDTVPLTPDTLTLQQVEREAASLDVTLESLLLMEMAG